MAAKPPPGVYIHVYEDVFVVIFVIIFGMRWHEYLCTIFREIYSGGIHPPLSFFAYRSPFHSAKNSSMYSFMYASLALAISFAVGVFIIRVSRNSFS